MQTLAEPTMTIITVFVNGSPCEIAPDARLSDLIAQLGLDDTACATAVNGQFVPRQGRRDCLLHDADQVMTFEPITGG
jgi:sulfur carrier protein